jgi:transcriptional regulator with XRE-family HTH domain
MDASAALHEVRKRAGLSQAELATRGGTSQATISAYENGTKQPSVATFSRLLAAAGARLSVEPRSSAFTEPSSAELEHAGKTLAQVIALAEALPIEHDPDLRFPRLDRAA